MDTPTDRHPESEQGAKRPRPSKQGRGTCDLSICIVSWNTRDLLRECLQSIFEQTKGIDFEVIIADNASSDGSCEMLEEHFPQVTLIRNPSNVGFGAGCNQGMREAGGRYFLLLNSDTVIVGNAISELVRFMDRHGNVGAGGCMLLYPDGHIQPSCGWFPNLTGALFNGLSPWSLVSKWRHGRKHFNAPLLSYSQHSKELDVDWIVGACIMVRREVVEQVGLMDERIFLFGEEWEWCLRIKSGGWRVVYTPGPKVVHVGAGSWTMSDRKRVCAILESQHYIFRKNYGILKARTFKVVTFVNALLKAMMWSVLTKVSPSIRSSFPHDVNWHTHSLHWCLHKDSGKILSLEDVVSSTPPSGKSGQERAGEGEVPA